MSGSAIKNRTVLGYISTSTGTEKRGKQGEKTIYMLSQVVCGTCLSVTHCLRARNIAALLCCEIRIASDHTQVRSSSDKGEHVSLFSCVYGHYSELR
jgi:hypothetical protein